MASSHGYIKVKGVHGREGIGESDGREREREREIEREREREREREAHINRFINTCIDTQIDRRKETEWKRTEKIYVFKRYRQKGR